MITFQRATYSHGEEIARNLRPLDRAELRAMGDKDPAFTLRSAIALSGHYGLTALVDGRPVAAMGIYPQAAIGDAVPWMLATPQANEHPKVMLQIGRKLVAYWLEEFPLLLNEVWMGNTPAVSYLARLGFEFTTPRLNQYDEPVALFYKRRTANV